MNFLIEQVEIVKNDILKVMLNKFESDDEENVDFEVF